MIKYISAILCMLGMLIIHANGQTRHVAFDQQFVDTIYLPSKGNYIKELRLMSLKGEKAKRYYQTNRTGNNDWEQKDMSVLSINKMDFSHVLLFPPLEANRVYKLEIDYVGRYNIYGLFRSMHEEGITLYKEDKTWMEIIRTINKLSDVRYKMLFHPHAPQLEAFKMDLMPLDLNKPDTVQLKALYVKHFEVLKFGIEKIQFDSLVSFGKWVIKQTKFNHASGSEFINWFRMPDYLRIFDFYERRLKVVMDNQNFHDPKKFLLFVNEEITKEYNAFVRSASYDPEAYTVPGYLDEEHLRELKTYTEDKPLSTFPQNYATQYKRLLVPDFGYVSFLGKNNELRGGAPYIGVHLSLFPVNKEVPYKLAKLPFHRRLSFHTGIVLQSLDKEGEREDFFDGRSLLLGGGIKFLSQSTRINFGGVLFKQIDTDSGEKSTMIRPYIGLSIDIEIRKWLEESLPSFSNLFKGGD